MNCRWCQDRRGGCLYCPPPATVEERIAQALEHLALRGVPVVHFIATESEERRRAAWVAAEAANRRPRFDFAPAIVCAVNGHEWLHLGEHFRKRLCPRCGRRERWHWLPRSTERNGEWRGEEPAPKRTNRKLMPCNS